MTTLRKLSFAALASVAIATTALTPMIARASQATDPVVAATRSALARDELRLSQDAFNTMRGIRAARIAIFNGDTAGAAKLIDTAKLDIEKARGDDTVIRGKGGKEPAGNWVPFDGQLLIDHEYVDSPEKAAHVKAGNDKLKQGKTDEALDELKLAAVDVGYTRLMMPLDETSAHVDKAAILMGQQKFYEANLELKAAEAGVDVETVMLVEMPAKDTAKTGDTGAKDTGQTPAAAAPAKPADARTN